MHVNVFGHDPRGCWLLLCLSLLIILEVAIRECTFVGHNLYVGSPSSLKCIYFFKFYLDIVFENLQCLTQTKSLPVLLPTMKIMNLHIYYQMSTFCSRIFLEITSLIW
jgi:hypothetical protein